MKRRNSKVSHVYVNSVAYGSVFQIGDAVKADPYLRAIAVQKEGAFFDANDFPFASFPMFTTPFPKIVSTLPVDQQHIHHDPNIHVHSFDIEGMTGASIVQIGSLKEIDAKARIKHFRIVRDED
ncbi:spore germination protein GerPE [Salinibacillus xinjiangensis]|nr:spore germination protein GerPE [Salinibacillus xinjiangensis]